MASLIKQPTSKYWTAAFRDAKGNQYRRSTREVNRKRAQAVADKFELAAQAKGNLARVRRTINEFLRDHYEGEVPFITTQGFVDQWLSARKAETAPASYSFYKAAADKLLAFLGTSANASMEDITKAQIFALRDALAADHSPGTVNARLHVIKRIFREARVEGYILADPAERVKTVRSQNDPDRQRRAFTIDEIKRILEVADDEWRSMVKFGLYTGQRLGDLVTLTWAQIDLERDEITLTTQKTGKRLLIPIAAPLREHILTLESGDDPRSPVHPKAHETYTHSQANKGSQLSGQFGDILAAAGLRDRRNRHNHGKRSGRCNSSGVSFHSLRHSAVSMLKESGVPEAVVMELIGHDSAAMSAHYTHVGKEALIKAAGTFPEL